MFWTSVAQGLWDCCECSASYPAGPGPGYSMSTVLEVCFGCHMGCGGGNESRKTQKRRGKEPKHLWSYAETRCGAFSARRQLASLGGPIQGVLCMSSVPMRSLLQGEREFV